MSEKLIYCYNCKSYTIYNNRDSQGNSGVESHCKCGMYEWQNRAIEREKERWIHFNREAVERCVREVF